MKTPTYFGKNADFIISHLNELNYHIDQTNVNTIKSKHIDVHVYRIDICQSEIFSSFAQRKTCP